MTHDIMSLMVRMAANPEDDFGRVLRRLPFIQEEMLKRKLISLDDLTDEEIGTLGERAFDSMKGKVFI